MQQINLSHLVMDYSRPLIDGPEMDHDVLLHSHDLNDRALTSMT
jgi:hypothetical protein